MKNAFIRKAETLNAGTKFIIRDKVQQQMEEHKRNNLNEIEARQRGTPRGKECGCTPIEEEGSKKVAKSLIQVSSSGSLSSFRPII